MVNTLLLSYPEACFSGGNFEVLDICFSKWDPLASSTDVT